MTWTNGLMPLLAKGGGGSAGDGGGSDGGAGGDGVGGGDLGGGSSPVTLRDDAMVQLDGMDKPMKFGDWKAGYVPKGDHEKVSGELTNYKQRIATAVSEYLRSLQSQPGHSAQPAAPADELDELLTQLEEAPWVDGKTVKTIISKLKARTGEGSGKVEKQMGWLYQQLTAMHKKLQTLEQGRSEESLNQQITSWLKDNDFDPEHYEEYVRDMFAAYEGKPKEIFDLAKKRIDQFEAGHDARLKRQRAPAGGRPAIPGRGGTPALQTKAKNLGDKSPEEVANELWDMLREPQG